MRPVQVRGAEKMTRGYRWLVAFALIVSLSGCSTIKGWFEFDDDDDPKQPAKLVEFDQTIKIKKLWSHGIGNGQGAGFYQIQPAIKGGVIFAAAADGHVEAFDKLSGKSLWDVELELPLSGGIGIHIAGMVIARRADANDMNTPPGWHQPLTIVCWIALIGLAGLATFPFIPSPR